MYRSALRRPQCRHSRHSCVTRFTTCRSSCLACLGSVLRQSLHRWQVQQAAVEQLGVQQETGLVDLFGQGGGVAGGEGLAGDPLDSSATDLARPPAASHLGDCSLAHPGSPQQHGGHTNRPAALVLTGAKWRLTSVLSKENIKVCFTTRYRGSDGSDSVKLAREKCVRSCTTCSTLQHRGTLQCGTCRPGAGARNCVFWSEARLVVEMLVRLRGLAASVKPDMTARWLVVSIEIYEFLFSKLRL